ncbi:MAG: translation initiation factor IF-2 [Ignavibacteria bacterium GWA2_55_11]|nr:MAG: translation initiation factor IF-2 [Ignavibacteria bacterium GWA2_55_11]OGU47525.1 MAG: translation initiation factor IF-2 [Ignavibacteria bacterium GWC2_56_12]OGU72679.1 MAG: translation initiation factor IF-2 [Ignavibacteria bacterium RIFCSPLOWO2_02_FULL_55_14]OGU73443.1 MAG: translation initiation factor IF-2 [Ignavibacteria bacterium RIFCSPLOWO2_12_FULL_56_21]
MAEKKVKIYNLAKELNLASETILEFLHKKGFDAKNHMSVATDDMIHAVMAHFKKERDVAERHQRKVQEFRTSRKKEPSDKSEKKAAKDEAPAKPEEAATELPAEAEVTVAEPVVEVPTESLPETATEEHVAPAEVPAEIAAAATSPTEEPVPPSATAPASPDLNRVRSPLETLQARSGRGLTIKGKMDLVKPKPAAPVESEEDKKKKKKKKKVRAEVVKAKPTALADEEEGAKGKKRKKGRRAEVSEIAVDKAIRETLSEMTDDTATSRAAIKKRKKEKREEEERQILEQIERDKSQLRMTEFVTVGELANMMRVTVAEVIQKVMSLGIMVSINQRLDKDTITLVADEFGFHIDFQHEFASDELRDEADEPEDLKPRAPVVTIMGHVDHGKTSLLDYIRRANVVAGESGGITQHIGAYEVSLPNGKQITFLDTPGHEAFTAMRARGAQVTDIVVLVVAADDSVMPQTIEAISHAQAANVPMIVAINKIDKPDANPDRIKQQLADRGLLVEDYGGKHQVVALSARSGKNVELLLEKILLEAEVLELKANPDRLGRGAVVEAELDKGKGITATVLVQKGTLNVGDAFVCGIWSGRIRAMFDERGGRVEHAKPSQPVQLIGFEGIPQAGDPLIVMNDEREAREISNRRQQLKREQDFRQNRRVTLDDISQQIKTGQVRDLPIIVKADVDGSAEALSDSLMKLSTGEVNVQVIHKAVGGISESDVLLAVASQAIIIGFHVRPNLKARQLAEQEDIDIRLYSIIYDAINDVKNALEGMLAPTVSEEVTSTVEVRDIFKISKVGTIAGCFVREGKINRNSRVRLVRDAIQIFDGTLASLKRFKDDVREVEQGFECGISLENFNDVKVGDVIESYRTVETKRKLD